MKRFFSHLENVPNKYIKDGLVHFFMAFSLTLMILLMIDSGSYEDPSITFFIILLGVGLGYSQYQLSIARGREKYLKERLAKHDPGFDKNWGNVSKWKRMAIELVFLIIAMGIIFSLYLLIHPWFAR